MTTQLYCSTIDGKASARASGIYANADKMAAKVAAQNEKAAQLGIKTRYQLTECDESWLSSSGGNMEQVIQ